MVAIIGREIIAPYFTKSINEYLVSCSLTKLVNMMPAKAPVGVKKAPRLLPIIAAYTAALFEHILEKRMLIGILLIKLETKKLENPYVQIVLVWLNNSASFSEIP